VSDRDAEGEVQAIEIGPDHAAADRGVQQLEQKQEMLPERMKSGAEACREISHLRSWIIKSAADPSYTIISRAGSSRLGSQPKSQRRPRSSPT
jgi:hypothetical protein